MPQERRKAGALASTLRRLCTGAAAASLALVGAPWRALRAAWDALCAMRSPLTVAVVLTPLDWSVGWVAYPWREGIRKTVRWRLQLGFVVAIRWENMPPRDAERLHQLSRNGYRLLEEELPGSTRPPGGRP